MPQEKVFIKQSFALLGSMANLSDPIVWCKPTYLVAPGATVKVGNFFWSSTAPAGSDAENQDRAWAQGTGTGTPAGFAMFTPIYPLDANQSASLIIPEKFPILGAEKFAAWVYTDQTVSIGQRVFATLSDGSLQFGAADATITGAIATSCYVKSVQSGQDGNELALNFVQISNL